ncbi:HlyD family efflux transporter periplasmic adaptor subunit [Oscillatoria acuminata]|uniref:HlyD family secretion protein n=1 Tax=Oscillatoria acuminata PCC 6304 TaxID=56110 RepID=K9TBF4_9CYAN|nr:HlyD family efflux transporter periplasmic adaptor subunit [Oscillatoria acuminata]AFY79855.1 HlyD family secretion protein [Oscillatoria acuminata PCC 6304]
MNFHLGPDYPFTHPSRRNSQEPSSRHRGSLHLLDTACDVDVGTETVEAGDRAAAIYGGMAASDAMPRTVSDRDDDHSAHWSSAMQNLLDRPPASFPTQLLLGGMAFCIAFGAWSWFGRINEVGQAVGELIPQGDVYQVHPLEMGKVAKVGVAEGDQVQAGTVIAELDTQLAATEVDRLGEQLATYQMQLVQKQALMENTALEAETRGAIAKADAQAHQTLIAQAEKNVTTTQNLLTQLQADAAELEARRQTLAPLAGQAQQLVQQLQGDIEAQRKRGEILKPMENQTRELIERLETDVTAQQQRQQLLEPMQEKTQALIEQLKVDVAEQQERVERLSPLVDEGALSREHLFQAEQSLRDRQNALTRAEMVEATQAEERMFEAEQAERDRSNAVLRAQMSEVTSVQERMFEAEQALRDRQTAALRSQMSEATIAQERLFEAEQALRSHRQRITDTQAQLEQRESELAQLQAQQIQKQAEAERLEIESQQRIKQLQVEVTQLEGSIAQTHNRLTSAKAQLNEQFLYAPVDGTILALNISHPGEVVQPGQTLAQIAPEDAPLVLSAIIPSQEAGFIQTGMEVQVKLDAYSFQDYGVIPGEVTSISPQANADPQLGSVYNLEIALAHNYVTENGEKIYFKPGQTANADIIIRERRILDVILDPIRKLQDGGMNF